MSEEPRASAPEPTVVDTSPPASASASPYKNLFVPLIAVPALIVGAIVLVFLFFGAIAGREATLAENLERVINGGAGDHSQAAFNLVRQIAENQQARVEGRALPWPIDESFLPRLRAASKDTPADDPKIKLVLASLMTQLSDPQGVDDLLELAALSPAQDPDGFVRFNALATLGMSGDERAADALVRMLETSTDPGLRSVAAIALQGLPGERARTALVGALDDPELEVRANAAIGLAQRGDAAGARVLIELLQRATYAGEHERDAKKFAQARRISESRVKAIEALARLRRAEDRAAIERVADEETDLAVREAAMKALDAWK